jgi:excisionase family DNA binding protein
MVSERHGRARPPGLLRVDMTTERKLMTINEAAGYLGLSVHTLYAWTSQRKVPFVKLGNRVRFDVDQLNRWVSKHSVPVVPDR